MRRRIRRPPRRYYAFYPKFLKLQEFLTFFAKNFQDFGKSDVNRPILVANHLAAILRFAPAPLQLAVSSDAPLADCEIYSGEMFLLILLTFPKTEPRKEQRNKCSPGGIRSDFPNRQFCQRFTATANSRRSRIRSSLAQFCPNRTRLAAVVEAWPTLPEAIKAGILAMIRAAK